MQVKALSYNNLKVSFQKAGIYPLDRTAVPVDNFNPSEQYVGLDPTPVSAAEQSDVDSYCKAAESVIDQTKQYNKTSINKTLSSVVSGQEITRSDICQEIFSKAQSQPLCEPQAPKKRKNNSNLKIFKRSVSSQNNKQSCCFPIPEPVPGPSNINLNLQSDSYSDDYDSDIADEDKCCVCKQFQPDKLNNCVSLVITKWAQCDFTGCKHWTHLIYCCKERVIRRNDIFICPCHGQSSTEE
ncbi:hypothetical protein DPMN_148196 [Dreissena polymorpha]|uniref:Uncharacterized protein n=1 Tax=Dreissena polymorpha TaxID=45954 RepID=A0A9D4J3M7_DREPO|nr:hypothetical protein DPMN_148196 [Dreissena polymorpha]